MYACFSDNTSGDIWGGCIEVCFNGKFSKKCLFFPMCVQYVCVIFILAKLLLFVVQLSIDDILRCTAHISSHHEAWLCEQGGSRSNHNGLNSGFWTLLGQGDRFLFSLFVI
jgi:hypothetical protein